MVSACLRAIEPKRLVLDAAQCLLTSITSIDIRWMLSASLSIMDCNTDTELQSYLPPQHINPSSIPIVKTGHFLLMFHQLQLTVVFRKLGEHTFFGLDTVSL